MRATFPMKTVRNKSDERCSAFVCVAIVTAPCIYIWRVLLEEFLLTKPLQTNWVELNISKFRDRISPCTWCLLSASRLFHVSLNVFHYLLLFFPPRSFFFILAFGCILLCSYTIALVHDLLHIRAMRKFIFNKFEKYVDASVILCMVYLFRWFCSHWNR